MATKISIKNLPTGYQSLISNGRHAIIGDEPITSKGTDLGFTPTELVLAGISMCKVATIRNVARRKGWTVRDVDAHLEQVVKRDKAGNLHTTVYSEIDIDGDITAEQRQYLIQEADNCYVTRMVRGSWEIAESNQVIGAVAV